MNRIANFKVENNKSSLKEKKRNLLMLFLIPSKTLITTALHNAQSDLVSHYRSMPQGMSLVMRKTVLGASEQVR